MILLLFNVLTMQQRVAEFKGGAGIIAVRYSARHFATYFNILRVISIVGLVFFIVDFFAYKEERRWFSKLAGLSAMIMTFFVIIFYWKLESALSKLTSIDVWLDIILDKEQMIFNNNYTMVNVLLE